MKNIIVRRYWLFFVVTMFALLSAANSATFAQDAKFKAGDRVEVDLNRSSERMERKWVKGKIVEVMMWNGEVSGIYIKTDDGREMTVAEKDLRPLTADANTPAVKNPKSNAPNPKTNADNGEWKPIVDENDTVLADRELLDCDFEQPKTTRTARPPVELLKKLIRCTTERPAMKGSDGAVTMDITKFVVGAPRKWVANSDFGNGNANTTVYSIEVGYTMTKFYRSGNQIRENVWIYGCWVNNVNIWECGTNKKVKEGAVKEVP